MNYWLFKSEPDCYSIAHLAAEKQQTARWDGIRNFQARNLLRDQVAKGDEVLFYHSRCKAIGVVGTMRVAKAAYPDPQQFNPDSDYFDPKASPDNPRWFCVDVTLARTFNHPVLLDTIKQLPEFDTMVLRKQSRLSIQPVDKSHYFRILELADRPPK